MATAAIVDSKNMGTGSENLAGRQTAVQRGRELALSIQMNRHMNRGFQKSCYIVCRTLDDF